MRKKLFKGTIAPMNISLNKFGALSMSQYDFTIYAYCHSYAVIKIDKAVAIRMDDDNYMFFVDTAKTGVGQLRFAVKALIPDPNMPNLVRPEVLDDIDSGYDVVDTVVTE